MTADDYILALTIWVFILTVANGLWDRHEHLAILDAIAELKDKRE